MKISSLKDNNYRLVIEIIVFLVLVTRGIIQVSLGPLIPSIIDEFGVTRGTVSWAISLVSIMSAIFGIPASILTTKFGIKIVFAVGAILNAAGILTIVSHSFSFLLLTRCLFGIGAAMTYSIAGGIVAQWYETRERSLINGFNIAAPAVGNAIALIITVTLALRYSWRLALTIYGILALVSALAWIIFGRERNKLPLDKQRIINSRKDISAVFRQRSTWLLAFSLFGPFCLSVVASSWLPTYYHKVFFMSMTKASSITAIFIIAGIPACIFGGILPMKIGLRKPFLLIPGIIICFAGLGTFLVNNMVVIYISMILLGVCLYIYAPTVFTIAMELPEIPQKMVPVVLAIALAIANIGSFIGPLIVGYLTDITGSYLPGLVICSVLSTSLFISGKLLPETGSRAGRIMNKSTGS